MSFHRALARRAVTPAVIDSSGRSRPRVLQFLYGLEARGLVRRVGSAPTDPNAYWTAEQDR